MDSLQIITIPAGPLRPTSGSVPALFTDAGTGATRRFIEFFTANIRNRNTRVAYARATALFARWCDAAMQASRHRPGPTDSCRGPKHVVKTGLTPVLRAEETRILLDCIDVNTIAGLRDRALIGVKVYSFARVGAVVGMKVEDYFQEGKRWWFRLHEKGGKRHEVPAHHNAEAYVDAYLVAAQIAGDRKGPLFRSLDRERHLTERRLHRLEVPTTPALTASERRCGMIERRARQAGLPDTTCSHTFRAAGITIYLQSGGTIEHAQQIANHESPRTTKLYDRASDAIRAEARPQLG